MIELCIVRPTRVSRVVRGDGATVPVQAARPAEPPIVTIIGIDFAVGVEQADKFDRNYMYNS